MLNKIRSYFSYILKRGNQFKCSNCKFEILPLTAYYQNDNTGEVLCRDCFDKKVLNGEILLTKV
jgi:hypothetical protein